MTGDPPKPEPQVAYALRKPTTAQVASAVKATGLPMHTVWAVCGAMLEAVDHDGSGAEGNAPLAPPGPYIGEVARMPHEVKEAIGRDTWPVTPIVLDSARRGGATRHIRVYGADRFRYRAALRGGRETRGHAIEETKIHGERKKPELHAVRSSVGARNGR